MGVLNQAHSLKEQFGLLTPKSFQPPSYNFPSDTFLCIYLPCYPVASLGIWTYNSIFPSSDQKHFCGVQWYKS